jgi:hypothetical protein
MPPITLSPGAHLLLLTVPRSPDSPCVASHLYNHVTRHFFLFVCCTILGSFVLLLHNKIILIIIPFFFTASTLLFPVHLSVDIFSTTLPSIHSPQSQVTLSSGSTPNGSTHNTPWNKSHARAADRSKPSSTFCSTARSTPAPRPSNTSLQTAALQHSRNFSRVGHESSGLYASWKRQAPARNRGQFGIWNRKETHLDYFVSGPAHFSCTHLIPHTPLGASWRWLQEAPPPLIYVPRLLRDRLRTNVVRAWNINLNSKKKSAGIDLRKSTTASTTV